jgi:Xaa-Pro aminopeptidase
MKTLPADEFVRRVGRVQRILEVHDTDLFVVYGDEYRRENLRYVSNYWPIFDRGMLVIGRKAAPVLLVAPEGEGVARELSVWKDIRIIAEVEPSYIPDKIDYGSAQYSKLPEVLQEVAGKRKLQRIKLCGWDAMPIVTFEALRKAASAAQIVSGDSDIYGMRLLKSAAEAEMLARAGEICDAGYQAILASGLVGSTEIQAAAIGEKAARDAGAEHIVFSIFCSGERTNTAVGRPSGKVIREGEMVMSSLAVQYEGYIASDAWPFVAGNRPNSRQRELIGHIVRAEAAGIEGLKAGRVAGEVVRQVRRYFQDHGLGDYDIYPPIHGNGLAEAESPYPDIHSSYPFEAGMGINFDVNVFKVPDLGSNRIEEGFIVTRDGLRPLSRLISSLREEYLAGS